MLIKALCDYYDVLFRQGKILSTALEKVNISYLISLTADGRVVSVRCCREKEKILNKKGVEKEKDVPAAMILPRNKNPIALAVGVSNSCGRNKEHSS